MCKIPDLLYKSIIDQMPVCTIDVLFFDATKKKILLFKRVNEPLRDIFFSIGGRLKKGEDFHDAALRLAKNELGIDIDKNKLVWGGIKNELFDTSMYSGVNLHSVNIYWEYIWESKKIILDQQHAECRWFDVDDESLHPFLKDRILHVFKRSGLNNL